MTIQEAFKERITELCQEYNLTINGIAMKAGITQSTLNGLMSGTSKNPTLRTIYHICFGLNIELKDFFNSDIFKKINED